MKAFKKVVGIVAADGEAKQFLVHGTKQTIREPRVLIKYENYKGKVSSSLGISATKGDPTMCFDLCFAKAIIYTGISYIGSSGSDG